MMCCFMRLIFFFKQKTAYEMRISDWSSDVCSSDLTHGRRHALEVAHRAQANVEVQLLAQSDVQGTDAPAHGCGQRPLDGHDVVAHGIQDRKSVLEGKSVSLRVDLGGRRKIKKKKHKKKTNTNRYTTHTNEKK